MRLLRDYPGFRLLWSAQVVSLLGDWFNTVVLSVLVAEYSDGSGLAVSLFLMVRFLPPMLVGPFAGVLVDRFNRKKILVYSNIIRTGVVLLFLLATTPDTLWLIYLLTIIQFTLSALFEPAQSAITPSLVPREGLVPANTLASITWSVMLALGAIIGGVVASIFGALTAIIIDALTFALAGYLISRIDYSREDRVNLVSSETGETGGFIEGLRYVRKNPNTGLILLVKGGSSLGNVDTLMTILATQVFIMGANGEVSLGIMYSAFGLGAILGPMLLNLINDGSVKRMRRLITIGFVLIGFGWWFIAEAATLWVLSAGLLIRAMGGSANWTYSAVILQKTVPDNYLGRVISLDLAFFQFATVVSIIVHGALVEQFGAERIPEIALGTLVVSAIPLLIWMFAIPRVERSEGQQVVPVISGN